jgi:hypothetical protein
MNGFIGTPSDTNYFEVYSLFLHYLRSVLELEKSAVSRPTHDTMQWYQILCFGGTRGQRDATVSAASQSLASGLTALLNQMQFEQQVRFHACKTHSR